MKELITKKTGSLRKRPPYEVEMIILKKGTNIHFKQRLEKLEEVIELDGFKYQIKPDALFIKKPNIFKRIYNRFRGIKKEFITIYRYKKPEPIMSYTSKISPYLLKTTKDSSALKRALEKELKAAFDIRKIIFLLALFIAAIFIYLYMTGGL